MDSPRKALPSLFRNPFSSQRSRTLPMSGHAAHDAQCSPGYQVGVLVILGLSHISSFARGHKVMLVSIARTSGTKSGSVSNSKKDGALPFRRWIGGCAGMMEEPPASHAAATTDTA